MTIKKNDIVKIIAGKDKGKTGKVLRVYPADDKIVVEGIAIVTKHVRARRAGEQGQKIFFPGRFCAAKAMLVCPKCGQATRVSHTIVVGARQKKDRQCKKCKQSFSV